MENGIEDVMRIGKKIMLDDVFYGYFLAMLDKSMSDTVPTAGVGLSSTGPALKVNDDFWKELIDSEKKAILTHEVLHVIFGHLTDHKYYEDPKLLNLAKDIEINQLITGLPGQDMTQKEFLDYVETNKQDIIDGKMKLPCRGVFLEDFGFSKDEQHKGTKYYYEELKKKSQKNNDLGKQIQQYCSQADDGIKHIFMHNWKEFEDLSPEEKELIEGQIKGYIKKIVSENEKTMNWGNIPGYMRELLEDLIKIRPPVVSWKYYFRKFVATSINYNIRSTRARPNRRIEDNPTMKFEQKLNIFVGLDTSASMGQDDINECFAEIQHFYKTDNDVIVGECDCSLNEEKDIYQYKGKYPEKRLGLSGGGGTSMLPLLKHVNKNRKKYSLFIYLTDGHMSPPGLNPLIPTIIVLTKTGADPNTMRTDGFPGVIIKMN